MTLVLGDADVRATIGPGDLIDGIEAAIRHEARGEVLLPARLNLRSDGRFLRIMPAMFPAAGVMGFKAFHGVPGQGVRYLVVLYSLETGETLALIDACYLTAARTAATSALAARYLADDRPTRLGVVGSGLEAEAHCMAIAQVSPVTEVQIFSPRQERRTALARRLTEQLGVPAVACARPEDVVQGADHVILATNTGAGGPIACDADWLTPGQHVSAIGSTNPHLRELDARAFDLADLLVFDADVEQVAEESGDVTAYREQGGDLDRVVTLDRLVTGQVGGRRTPTDLTVFKSVGTALQDVVAAEIVYRRAQSAGVGDHIPEVAVPKSSSPT